MITNPIDYFVQVQAAKVTSPYGNRPKHPVTGLSSFHYGTDLGGKPIGFVWNSPFPAVVTYQGFRGARGYTVASRLDDVEIDGKKVLQIMQHLQDFRCKIGDKLASDSPVGTNGTSGVLANGKSSVSGPHLHYELRFDNGSDIGGPVVGDPAKFIWKVGFLMDYLIVLHSEGDRGMGSLMEYMLKAPVIVRQYASQTVLDAAKVVIQIGGGDILKAKGEIIHLAGATRVETATRVINYINTLKK